MKTVTFLLSAFVIALASGCASTDQIILDSSKRPPTTSVEVFKDGESPNKSFKAIAELSFLGPREDELRAQKRFVAQAQKMGGNAVIFTVVEAGQKGGGGMWGFNTSTAWVFKGKVVVYE